MTPTDQAAVSRLAEHRIRHDLTYGQLAAAMTLALGVPVRPRALHLVLTGSTVEPTERTLYKVTRYVREVIDAPRKPARKPRRRVAA